MKVIYMVRMNINTEDQSLHVGLLKYRIVLLCHKVGSCNRILTTAALLKASIPFYFTFLLRANKTY